MSDNYDLDRITKVARDGLESASEQVDITEENIRLDNFIIIAIFASEIDGEDQESAVVWSETKKHHSKLGMIYMGLDSIDNPEDD